MAALLAELDGFFPGCAGARISVREVADEDWAEGWKQSFPVIDVGERLRVRPPWLAPSGGERLEVEIEPAMAFGTGQHASTLGCLLALEDLCAAAPAPPSVLDVGTGSAILAIAAARLGAERVLAVDIDPIAIEAARKNVERNRVGAIVCLDVGSLDRVGGRFALILANLYSGMLRGMFAAFAERAEPHAVLVVAGFLDADREAVSASARDGGWVEAGARSIDGWTTLTLRRAG
jgi:ribosomal protein L11 methyltransferase